MNTFEQSYLGQLRAAFGSRKLIAPGVRAIITDQEGQILFIRRRDNAQWALPAGGIELDESVLDALRREVEEETGLHVVKATLIAIYSEPRFSYTNMYGNEHQMLSFEFRVDERTGTVARETEETTDLGFFPVDTLPTTSPVYLESIQDFLAYDGEVVLK